MSGNNPHGHLSQPQNSSWNPLQIPSYIPRQPQLAHMSNERPMVRSPLAWHTPTPPESLYNFISANHKNLEQLNPLLPSFVRGPSSFDSMDLSLQSNRNSSSPLTKGLSASVPPEFGHKPPPPPPPPSHSQNNFPIHNLSTNSNVHHSQSMSSAPPPPLPKYMNTNGNDVDMQQQACSLYIRDTERINDDYAKMTNRSCENDIQSSLTKAVGLVKECTYTNLSNKMIPSSPKKISPPPLSHQQQLQHQLQQQYSCTTNGPNSPETNNRLTHIGNFNTPLNHMLNTESTTSSSCLPPKCGTDLTTATVTENSCNSLSTNDSPANVTSNEDSVDSSGSRTRRKRKPNKTVRMSHDSETDENISLGEQVAHQDKQTPPPLPTTVDVSNSNGSHSLPPELDLALAQENTSYNDHRIQEGATPTPVHQAPAGGIEKQQPQQQHQQLQQQQQQLQQQQQQHLQQQQQQHLQQQQQQHLQQQQQQQLQQHQQQQQQHTNDDRVDIRSSTESDEILHVPEIPNNNQIHRSDSDDVETIDKIAEMIAKSSSNSCALNSEDPMSSCSNGSNKKDSPSPVVLNEDEDDGDKSPLNAQQDTRNAEVPVEQPLSLDTTCKPNDLKTIFETSDPSSPTETSQKSTPSPTAPPPQQSGIGEEVGGSAGGDAAKVEDKQLSPDNKADNAKSTFEEVEYKLEEMFAGIEDEPQSGTAAPADDIANSEATTDLSLALALPTTKVKDDDEDSEHKPLSAIASTSNALQKRLHSTAKSEQGPPKKKARLTKKASNRRNKGKVMSTSTGSNKTSVAQGNKSKGGGGGGGGGGGVSGGGGSGSSGAKSVAAKIEESSLANVSPESKYRGPYVLVKPDGTINVINAPIAEEDSEKVSKVKKGSYTHVDRSKIRGIHMSTLGNKYDADTADATWMCVFCKKGPHKFGLGDLFGPYIITTKCEEFKSTEKDDVDSEFVSRRKKSEMFQKTPYSLPVVPSAHANAPNVNNKKKKKLSETQTSAMHDKSSEDRFFGMSKVSDTSYEVWMHEDCAVWAPGVFLVGARIVGLESSVWSSTNYTCNLCTQKGAMICCLHRGCGQKAHIPCARLSSWDLNEEDFKTYCEKHTQVMETSS